MRVGRLYVKRRVNRLNQKDELTAITHRKTLYVERRVDRLCIERRVNSYYEQKDEEVDCM